MIKIFDKKISDAELRSFLGQKAMEIKDPKIIRQIDAVLEKFLP